MTGADWLESWIARVLRTGRPAAGSPQAEPMSLPTSRTVFRPDMKVVDDATEIRFPIDIVYTWVDLTDRLRSDIEQQGSRFGVASKHADDTLYSNHDELRYSLRSVERYLPWVNRIFIVTNGQRPSWLDEHPKVEVVTHRDILDAAFLPTFNSHVIESALHRIRGLSEHYIYLNDDVIFLRPCRPNDFFTGSGLAYALLGSVVLPDDPPHAGETATNWAAKNARRMVQERFGVSFDRRFAHVFHCQRRSTGEECEELFKAEYSVFRSNRFRSMNDVLVASYLQHIVSYLRGRSIFVRMEHWYVQIRRREALRLYKCMLSERASGNARIAACFNDQPEAKDLMPDAESKLWQFLDQYFPDMSSFEKKGA
jgi:hypothetical protein